MEFACNVTPKEERWLIGIFSVTRVGARHVHRCQIKVSWAVETAPIQPKPACAGFRTSDFLLVRDGGLSFYSRDFQSPGLKLTPMRHVVPLQGFRTPSK